MPTIVPIRPEHRDQYQLERAARTALATSVGHDLADIEWERASARLREFVAVLRAWDLDSKTGVDRGKRGDGNAKAA